MAVNKQGTVSIGEVLAVFDRLNDDYGEGSVLEYESGQEGERPSRAEIITFAILSKLAMGSTSEFWISGVLISCVASLGIIGNIFCLVILSRKHVANNVTYNNLLKWLAVIDLKFLLSCFFTFSLPSLCPEYKMWIYPYLMPTLLPTTSILLTGSIYCVISLTVERYLCVCHPKFMNKGAFLGYILPLCVFSAFFNLPKFFELKTGFVKVSADRKLVPYVLPTEFRKAAGYSYYTIVSGFVFLGLIPLICVLILNTLVVRGINYSSGSRLYQTDYRRDKLSLVLLYSVVLLMMGCHLPRTILNCYELYLASVDRELKFQHPWLVDISHLFLALSATLNIFIYAIQDNLFCVELNSLLRPGGRGPRTEVEALENFIAREIVDDESGREMTDIAPASKLQSPAGQNRQTAPTGQYRQVPLAGRCNLETTLGQNVTARTERQTKPTTAADENEKSLKDGNPGDTKTEDGPCQEKLSQVIYTFQQQQQKQQQQEQEQNRLTMQEITQSPQTEIA